MYLIKAFKRYINSGLRTQYVRHKVQERKEGYTWGIDHCSRRGEEAAAAQNCRIASHQTE